MKTKKILKLIVLPIMTSFMLCACMGEFLQPKEDPTVFFMMRSNVTDKNKVAEIKLTEVNFLPVSIPAYMARTQIVSLEDSGRVSMSEFDRWSENPKEAVSRVLAENISALCKGVDLYSYPTVASSVNAPSLKITITEFIGTLGKSVTLKGKWRIITRDSNKKSQSKIFSISIPCENSYDSYVKAMNQGLFNLSKEIVEGFLAIDKK